MIYEKSCGAVVFTRIDGKILYLMVLSLQGTYGFPKGHVEGNETETETALREIREETGLHVRLMDGFKATDQYPISSKKETVKQVVYFLGTFENQTPVFPKEEIAGICLAAYDEAMALLQFESLKRILKEANDHLIHTALF